jgi:UPF0716 family protein affecting phage T7 exclusion
MTLLYFILQAALAVLAFVTVAVLVMVLLVLLGHLIGWALARSRGGDDTG